MEADAQQEGVPVKDRGSSAGASSAWFRSLSAADGPEGTCICVFDTLMVKVGPTLG